MYLKTLTLRGFKSFASATHFEFEPGVTCVVGPNGSGKSNVVDALAWVMGEQGAKTLRGGKMEDVIFAGTIGRQALGRAEVSLTIDNTDGALPIEYAEVTLTRTLFRNGGSEYAINGAACRLLDIQDLLSDSGLGREMHVIVGQGQLDAILRATPLERRGFIEEAAGVLKHRKRKEKALRKLDSMQGNLLRLSDLISELRRQLGPLGRQAQAARKAAVIAAQARDSGLRLLADDLNTQLNIRADGTRTLEEIAKAYRELSEHTQALRMRLQSLDKATAELLPAAQRASEIVMTLTGQREQLRSISQVAAERQRHLGSASQVAQSRGSQEIEQQLERASVALAQSMTELEQIRARVSDAEGERQRTAEQHALLTHKREDMRRRQSKHREKVSALGAQVASQRTRVEAISQNLTRLSQDVSDANTRHAQATTGVETGENGDQVTVAEDVAGAVHAFQAEEQALSQKLDDLSNEQKALRASHLEAERMRATHVARIAAYESALEQELGAAGNLVEQDPGLTHLGNHLDIDAEYERAVHAALGFMRNAVVATSWEHAIASNRAATAAGHQQSIVVYPFAGEPQPNRSWHEVLKSSDVVASAVVRWPISNSALTHLLEHVVITDMEQGQKLVRAYPFLTAVTPEGEVIRAEWIVSGYDQDQSFALQRKLDSERASASDLDKQVAVTRTQLEDSERQVQQRSQELKSLRAKLADAREHQRSTESARARLLAFADAASKEVERLSQQWAETQTRFDSESKKLTELVAQYEHIEQESTAANQLLEGSVDASTLDSDISRVELVLERSREVETLARLDLRSCQEKCKNLEGRTEALRRSLRTEQAAEQQAALAAQRRAQEQAKVKIVGARSVVALQLIEKSIERATTERDLTLSQRDRHAQELAQLRLDVAGRDEELRGLTDKMHSRELDLTSVGALVAQLEQRAIDEYSLATDELLEQFGPHLATPHYQLPKSRIAVDEELEVPDMDGVRAFDRDYLEDVHERAVKALAGLGKVNPLALEEYSALEERHKFLSEQLADLKKSREDLLELVNDIDTKVQQVFASAFDDTASQFARIFPRLFPGGEGAMFLTDPEDLLNTGIEIEARPAGKKVKRLSLLSGGERSLTAIAMLVSIFKARPSPFYVMDEVEAALDDVNLGRLLGVFKELQEDSQLIVITHQKRTMEIADALYGVSMQGDGISAVMSQKIERVTAV